jgi:hypothetical protein
VSPTTAASLPRVPPLALPWRLPDAAAGWKLRQAVSRPPWPMALRQRLPDRPLSWAALLTRVPTLPLARRCSCWPRRHESALAGRRYPSWRQRLAARRASRSASWLALAVELPTVSAVPVAPRRADRDRHATAANPPRHAPANQAGTLPKLARQASGGG